MSDKVEALALEVMKLAAEERIDLVDRILDGLEPVEDEVALAWAKLAQERLESVRRGETETFDADEVIRDAKHHLRRARERRQGKRG